MDAHFVEQRKAAEGRDGWVPSSLATAATLWLNLKVSLRRNTPLVVVTFCGASTRK
jgi:hypothetical protein